MPAVIPNEGRVAFANALIAYLNGCHVGLFVSNHTPVVADTLATYAAIEAAFGGYSRLAVTPWTSAGIDPNGNELLNGPTLTFTATGTGLPVTAFGYFLVDPTGVFCLAAELAAVPYTFTAAGQSLAVLPRLYLGGLASPF